MSTAGRSPWPGRRDAILLGTVLAALLAWSWGTWPDVLVDFGRELYVPWQLASGRVLYRDVAYFNGPLSPSFNALWFALLGPSLRALVLVNVAVLIAILLLLHALLATIGSSTSARVGCVTLLLLFAFGQLLPIGNYTYVAPYSHEMTHGLLLGLAAVLLVGRAARSGRTATFAASGLCVGLALLTKPEILIAVAVAATAGVLLALATRPAAERRAARALAAYAGAALLPPLASVALLARAMPLGDAAAGTLGGTRWLFASEVTSMRLYRATMGTLVPSASLRSIALATVAWLAFLGAASGCAALWRGARPSPRVRAALAFAAVVALLLLVRSDLPWLQALLPLPLVMLLATPGFGVAAWRTRDAAQRPRLVVAATLSLLALLLLAKIVLRVRAAHYGFVLAMPATMVAIVLVWDWLPRLLGLGAERAAVLRGAFLGALAVTIAMHGVITVHFTAAKTVRVGTGGDAFWADAERGREVVRLLAEVAARVPPGATVSVVPEGAMINYLSRHPDSTPYISFLPGEVAMFGEDAILASLRAHPPDFVVVVARPLEEFGYTSFGVGYAERLAAWLGVNYRRVDPTAPRAPLVLLRRAPREPGAAP